MTVVAKMTVQAIEDYGYNKRVKLQAVHDAGLNTGDNPENRSFTKATPWGECSMSIDNPHAVAQFKVAQSITGDPQRPGGYEQASTHYVLFIDASQNNLEDVMKAAAQLR